MTMTMIINMGTFIIILIAAVITGYGCYDMAKQLKK